MTPEIGSGSTAAKALEAAGDAEGARDIGALDEASGGADRKLAPTRRGLVERLKKEPGSFNVAADALTNANLALLRTNQEFLRIVAQ